MQKTFQPGGKETRSFTFARASADTKARTVELSFSSEEPIERLWGIEILDHKSKSVRLDRLKTGGPLLVCYSGLRQTFRNEKNHSPDKAGKNRIFSPIRKMLFALN